MGSCNYLWFAPKLFPPAKPGDPPHEGTEETTCDLEEGHKGHHRSWAGVITPNKEEQHGHQP